MNTHFRSAAALPPLAALMDNCHVVTLPMRVRFRGVTHREVMLIEGPFGWGEFAPFPEYGDDEAATWLQSAIAAAWSPRPLAVRAAVEVNATVPAVQPEQVAEVLARFPGATTAKVKVAEKGQTLADDVARVDAVRQLVPSVRVDANGGWTVHEAIAAFSELGPLEYAEQPCRTVDELAELRRQVPTVKIAADESIRRSDDPLRIIEAGAADIAVVKVAPLGGANQVLAIADILSQHNIPVVVSSALDSAIGIAYGVATAAALPQLKFACGLATSRLFADDVAEPPNWDNGRLVVTTPQPDPSALRRLRANHSRQTWWRDRLVRCHAVLAAT
ncbi:o-succinylbenzoate synthase [Hoyosella rhizosphaerae]|uniref:o-succinylbenzoate synthase n=1 Tax=Hoyosella rhizosphaerae TaxID=1755582 RepID=A0A916ULC9_9ACTN|nr:o-succinylbenzoate synthase [Hoyosella rhizosphaerae]MBN4925267.1 o-succinylbenzoate synthase [Hoyosella rhizosphaerae]GGC76641.1 o-succinylbenzoate synthase [Hoyosella rhizosphaerae]